MSSADFLLYKPLQLSGAVSFSRPSPKWVYDRTGTLVQVPANTLGVTYDPADLSKAPWALIEPAAPQLLRYTEELNNGTAYGGSQFTIAANAATAPSGAMAADRMAASADTAFHYLDQEVFGRSYVDGEKYTFSVFARADTISRIRLDFYYSIGGTGGFVAAFNLATGTIDGGDAYIESRGARIQALPGGWFRCSIVGIVSQAAAYPSKLLCRVVLLDANGNGSYAGVNAPGAFMWGWNLTPGDKPSSYIASGATPLTRAADVVGAGAGLVYSSVAITEPLWVAGTYAQGATVRDSDNFVFESLASSNSAPLTEKTKWLPLGKTNQLKMFDKAVNSQTTAPDSLTVVVKPGQLANTLTLLNIAGAEVTVTQSESGYTRQRALATHNVLSWYDFYYQEPQWIGDTVFADMPPYLNSLITVHVKSPGNIAGLGGFFLGRPKFIGKTQWGLKAGILSYSSQEADTFGNVTLMKRASAKKMNFEVAVPRGYEDEVYRFMTAADNEEMIAIASTNWAMTLSYGYLGQWELPLGIEGEKMPVEWRGLI
jgi:hypothetical protein